MNSDMRVVISQSMYFPWVGMLEQLRLADIFVHYDDVQFARGFYNRVQIKTQVGIRWLTIPLRDKHRGVLIDEALIDDRIDWRSQHRDLLRQAYRQAPYREEMLQLVDGVFAHPAVTLHEIARESFLALAHHFDLAKRVKFLDSARLGIKGASSQRLHDLCVAVQAGTYITGHGARNYLDHQIFEDSGITVEYMNYRRLVYPQLHGEFTPFVSGLDLVANCGSRGADVICSESVNWKEFLNAP